MDLWIRSQNNKHLIKANAVYIDDTGKKIYDEQYCDLGHYKSRERALEVLDEIQDFVENQDTVIAQLNDENEVVNQQCHKKVYQMPKE